MLGAFVDGELAGFIGRHDQGALGVLEVLPEYRPLRHRGGAGKRRDKPRAAVRGTCRTARSVIRIINASRAAPGRVSVMSFADKNVWWLEND